ncbi:Zn-dependent amino-or carboxypeptidase, M28 family [Dyella sp. OK004]|uniref:M28 family peptidase n=1 Tax=Dyella sp. OK004 TaxID=1855292 RepID=UPI0008F301E7|nr:M28 family peptidase [Dyella sp. OK004]SFS04948.1 Zn-dependent amino-or carboxypeptidase, M28 family [Dyella sp. OK004]
MRRFLSIIVMCVVLAACQHHQANSRDGDNSASAHFSPGIMPADLAAHIKVLTSPGYRDRSPGSEGERRTVTYLIEQFQRIGLQPANSGNWVQYVPYVASTVQHPQQVKLAIAGGKALLEFAFGDEMVVNSPANQEHAALHDSPIVFVGYGVDAPEQQWNDYAGVDLKGKTVVVLSNDPGWGSQDPQLFKGRTPTNYGRWTYKVEQAALHGAAAAFVVHDAAASGYAWHKVKDRWGGAWYNPPGRAGQSPSLPIAGWLTTEAARKLFASAGADFDALAKAAYQRGFKPVALDATASVAINSSVVHGQSQNVIAKMPGSKHDDEAVIYSTHWDQPEEQDSQAVHSLVDSAAGLAGLLEMAEAFAHRAPKPHRSVLFLALTMEESGLLGSHYYVEHPVVALDRTVADINMDALPELGPSHDVAVVGYGQSQLDDYLADAVRAQHRNVTPDDAEIQGLFYRSDQLSFASHGVPVLYARSGLNLVTGGLALGRKRFGEYLGLSDNPPASASDPQWDLRGVAEDLRALFMVGGKLSMETPYPQWKPEANFQRPASMR